MERLHDKMILLAVELAAGMAFAPRAATVACLLAGATAAFLAEACRPPAHRPPARAASEGGALAQDGRLAWLRGASRVLAAEAPTVLPAGVCVLALAVPEAIFALPLAAYDLTDRSRRALLALPALALVAALRAASAPVAAAILLTGLTAAACLLAGRTEATRSQRLANRRERDDLAARSQALEVQNRELRDKRELEVRVAVLEERSRIAREIHDNVGHLLTRAHLQAEAYQVVFVKDERARAAFEALGKSLSEALDTVRASVHDLHDDQIDLAAQIERIAAESGLSVQCRLEATTAPPEVAACLRAVAREALSNAAHHAAAHTIALTLVEYPAFWQMTIENDGAQCIGGVPGPSRGTSGGMGLVSLEERVQALDGTFRAGPVAGGAGADGWRVFASIPKRLETRKGPR
ncbi:sensor histidine kinase [Collinsella intestinalis]|uniref:sensor histidine kinase n=1 Tax=Collinsella intestinalis TaxID=147207 RepID=UPI00195A6F53|nr:histidine kinase [Collinsella intestinalis]MBM6943198.1 sensor histidine kinase [Collinsella intestinalis]